MQKKVNPMLEKLAKKYGLPKDVIQRVVESPFFFTKEKLRGLEATEYSQFPHFRYKFIGSLKPNKNKIDKFNNNKSE